jgi:hypothetical protein
MVYYRKTHFKKLKKEFMEQNAKDKNQNSGFFKQNMPPILVAAAVIVIGAIIFFSTRDNPSQQSDNNQPSTEQNNGAANGENANNNGGSDNSTDGSLVSDSTDNSTSNSVGNVSASGTLMASDNADKGNLVVDSSAGKIYIKTGRDFSSLIGKNVTLQAEGTINKFVFLGFAEATVDAGDVGGGEPVSSANVSFSGILNKNNSSMGDYTVVSGNTTVYLKTVHDYSSLVGSEVVLKANGTLKEFTGATISKK